MFPDLQDGTRHPTLPDQGLRLFKHHQEEARDVGGPKVRMAHLLLDALALQACTLLLCFRDRAIALHP